MVSKPGNLLSWVVSPVLSLQLLAGRDLRDARDPSLEPARNLDQKARPLQQSMGIRLVAEADAAVDLNILAGVLDGCGARDEERAFDLQQRVVAAVIHGHGCEGRLVAASRDASAMLAQWCFTAWKLPIGRPNCSRMAA